MYFVIIFFSFISFFSAQAMLQSVPEGPLAAATHGASDLKESNSFACSGMVYRYPTLDEVKSSSLGAAISRGDLAEVRLIIDGPSGLRSWAHWLLTDDKRQWVRAAHGLLQAIELPHETTGPVVGYLWKKVKKERALGREGEYVAYDPLESKGTCLILNACHNGHDDIFSELIENPDMQYGVRESLRYAVQTNNLNLLQRLLSAGARCEDDLLIKAMKEYKDVAAFWLVHNKIGLKRCDQRDGSALHIGIINKSVLVPRIIQALPPQNINCCTLYVARAQDGSFSVIRATALDFLLEQEKPDEVIVEMLIRRGGKVGPSASQKVSDLERSYCKKFGLACERLCMGDTEKKMEVECLPARKLA